MCNLLSEPVGKSVNCIPYLLQISYGVKKYCFLSSNIPTIYNVFDYLNKRCIHTIIKYNKKIPVVDDVRTFLLLL